MASRYNLIFEKLAKERQREKTFITMHHEDIENKYNIL